MTMYMQCGIKILEKTSDYNDPDGAATKNNGCKCEMSFTEGGMFGNNDITR